MATIFNDRIQKAKKINKKKVNDDDEEYVPEYEGGFGSNSSSEKYEYDKHDEFVTINDLESRKRKITLDFFFIIMLIYIILLINEWGGFVSETTFQCKKQFS